MSAVIAIDGPAASGKSTVAGMMASVTGFKLMDTGAMYRSVTLLALERGVPIEDAYALGTIAREVRRSFRAGADDGPTRFYLGERDVTEEIRSPEVGDAVSPVSRAATVRMEMVELQREYAAGADVVVEGRDIGSVVFPDASLKVYLDADADERKRRRLAEMEERGREVDAREVGKEIDKRDRIDSSRDTSPLARVEDALYIDTTGLSAEQVCGIIEDRWKEVSGRFR